MDKHAPSASADTPAACTTHLVRTALKAALATSDESHPYASLVLVATLPDATPILLISKLAQHTRNLAREPRASLLFDGTDGVQDPLSGPRASLRARKPARMRMPVHRVSSARKWY